MATVEQPHDYYNLPPAYLGFCGFLRLQAGTVLAGGGVDAYSHRNMTVRATSADMNTTQEVTKPDIIDSRFDKTVYQLGPKLVEGSISFPAVYDIQGGVNIVEALYCYAVTRKAIDGLISPFALDVKYAVSGGQNDGSFVYMGCIANTFKFAVTNEDVVNINVDIIGLVREQSTEELAPPSAAELTNTRIVTWNDARVELVLDESRTGGGLITIGGEYVRSFECNINNAAERFYTLNKQLFPQAVAPTKRDVDGSLELLGRHRDLADIAWTNENFCSESSQIKFGFVPKSTTADCNSTFGVTLPNCIFEIEEMSLGVGLFVTTVNWHSLPAAGNTTDDPLLESLNSTVFNY